MKVKCGDMYMVSLDHPSNLYGWSVSRVWWRPWRYNLYLFYMEATPVFSKYDLRDKVLKNLTKDGLVGTLKLMELWKD